MQALTATVPGAILQQVHDWSGESTAAAIAGTRREILQWAAALCGARFARGQDAPVFSADVKVVNVLATVRNRTGSLAGNLNRTIFR